MKKHRFKQVLIICLSTVLFYVLLSNFNSLRAFISGAFKLFSPIITAILLAILFNVPLRFFENKVFKRLKMGAKGKRAISMLCTYIALLAAATAVFGIIIPQVGQSFSLLVSRLPDYADKFSEFISDIRQTTGLTGEMANSIIAAVEEALASISSYISVIAERILNFTISFASGVFDAIMAFIMSVYILASKEKLSIYAQKIGRAFLPDKVTDYIIELLTLTNDKLSGFISGQVFEGVLLGTMCGLGMLIIRLPYPLLISVIVGVTALVPVVGPWVGTILSALLILFESPLQALIFVIFLILLQQLDNNVIYPRVIGNAVGLDGLWIIVAVTIGGALGGALGMLLAVPILSVIWVVFAKIVNKRLAEKEKSEQNK